MSVEAETVSACVVALFVLWAFIGSVVMVGQLWGRMRCSDGSNADES